MMVARFLEKRATNDLGSDISANLLRFLSVPNGLIQGAKRLRAAGLQALNQRLKTYTSPIPLDWIGSSRELQNPEDQSS